MKRLAQGKSVTLIGDRTQAKRDRYKRLLAYVTLPGGSDLGRRVVSMGYAKVYVYGGRAFLRVNTYRAAEREARSRELGIWGNCSSATVIPVPVPTPPAPPKAPTTTTPTTTIVPFVPTVPTPTGTTATTPTTTGTTTAAPTTTTTTTPTTPQPNCHPSYPDFCIQPPPPDKNCGDFSQKNFRVRHDVSDPDPHRLDGDKDGRACES